MAKKKMDEKYIIKILNSIYDNVLNGLPTTSSIYELAEDYLKKSNGDKERAIDSIIRWHSAKNAASGFSSILGPITLPVDLTATFYFQMRMVVAIAIISGYDVKSDQVKTFVYCSLTGSQCLDFLKEQGLKKIGQKLTHKLITSIKGETLVIINRFVGFRLVTKFGEKGVVNLGKCIPIVSGVIGGTVNGYSCQKVGKTAKKLFLKG